MSPILSPFLDTKRIFLYSIRILSERNSFLIHFEQNMLIHKEFRKEIKMFFDNNHLYYLRHKRITEKAI